MVSASYILNEGPTMDARHVNHPGLTWTALNTKPDEEGYKNNMGVRANPKSHNGTFIHRVQIQNVLTHEEVATFAICCMPHPRYLVSSGGESYFSKHVNLIRQMYTDVPLPVLVVQDQQ